MRRVICAVEVDPWLPQREKSSPLEELIWNEDVAEWGRIYMLLPGG
jgi:hypothetical protein